MCSLLSPGKAMILMGTSSNHYIEEAANGYKENLASDYDNKELTIGDLQGVVLKEIYILELFFPNTNALTRKLPTIPTTLFVTTTTRRRNHTKGAKNICVYYARETTPH